MSIEPAPFRRVAIAGVGLIGGSIALAIRRHWRSVRVIAIDRAPVLDSVMRAGAADVGGDTLDVARDADLVVLAAPVMENIALLRQLPGYLEPGAIVTDVGSTKRAVVAAANAIPSLTFVGGHPMSGAAAGGFGAARPDLFDGRPWILTPDARPAATVDRLDAFVTGLGAVPHIMTADLHDRLDGLPGALRIDDGRVSLDESRSLELPDASRTGRGREADALGEVSDADSAVPLQDIQNSPIRLVELHIWRI